MHKGSKLIPIVENGPPGTTTCTAKAMALATLGIPVDPDVGAQHFREQTRDGVRETTMWILGPRSACGNFKTGPLVEAWDDRTWCETHREHPFAILRAAYLHRHDLIARVKSRPTVPEALPGESGPCSISDVQIVASLRALGIPFAAERPLLTLPGRPTDYLWTMAPSSQDGTWQTASVLSLYHDREWRDLNPDHAITYLRAFWKNYQSGLQHIAAIGPLAIFRNGRRSAIISRDTTPEDREKYLKGLNKR